MLTLELHEVHPVDKDHPVVKDDPGVGHGSGHPGTEASPHARIVHPQILFILTIVHIHNKSSVCGGWS